MGTARSPTSPRRSVWPTSIRPGTGVSMGAVWGDFDNDGYEDLFLYKYGRPELFHNDSGRSFVRVSERAGLPRWVNANAAIWWDYDRDGRLDLFLAGYWPETLDLWHLETTTIMPESFEYAENGGRKYVFHNRGDGTFEETSAALGIPVPSLDARGGSRGFVRQRLSRSVSRQRLRRLGALRQSRRQDVRRGGRDSRRRPHAEERHERVVRRHLQRRPSVDLQDEHFRAGRARAGQRSLGAEGARGPAPGSRSSTRTSPRPWDVDLGGWSWGAQFGDSEQRRHARSVSRERLRLGRRSHELLVRLRADRGRAPPDHWRRRELAGDARPQPLRLSAQTRVDERRRRPLRRGRAGGRRHRHATTAARSRSPTSAIAAHSTWSSPISADRSSSTRTRSIPARHWIDVRARGHDEQSQRHRRARRRAVESDAARSRT